MFRKGKIHSAGCISLGVWLSLGTLATLLASQPAPANHILNLVSSGQVDLSSPLRWHGRLRDEPVEAPWGTSYDVALDSVEFGGTTFPASGGIHLNYSLDRENSQFPRLHSGDGISFLAQAHLPQAFRNEGTFDRLNYLRQQGVDLVASLRARSLLEKEFSAPLSVRNLLARVRSRMRSQLEAIFPSAPEVTGILRAMLLGDRSFIDRDESISFQKTGVFHVLVVAGLHVGAFAVFLYWLGRKFRLSIGWTNLLLLFALAAYVSVIEQRPPVLRAALMALVLLIAGYFFRRLELLNSAAIAALVLLVANPNELCDSSFQLSFLSIGCIAGIAVPWMGCHIDPYVRALRGWRDVTRDAAHEPRLIQFRIDLRWAIAWFTSKATSARAKLIGDVFVIFLQAFFRICEVIFLTLVLQMGMSPLMALDFHRVTLFGAFGNLIAVPLTGILVPFGFAVLLVAFISATLASWLAVPLRLLTELLIQATAWFSHMPHSNYRVAGPPVWLLVLFFVLLAFLVILLRSQFNRSRLWPSLFTATLLVATVLIATHPFAPHLAKGKFELSVLDVGQGDSLFLASPLGHTMLIDAGGPPPQFGLPSQQHAIDPGEEAVSPFLWSRGIKKIDVVALTHAHQDHLGGIPSILENFEVGALWIGREVQVPALEKIEAIAKERNIPVFHQSRGQKFNWDGVEGRFLWPEPDFGTVATAAKNNDSLVLHMQFRNRGILLPGDAESQTEADILSGNAADSLRADILKVGHHGSKNSTTPEFLAAIHPQLAIISSGAENPYGHPSPALLQRLEQANAKILRTDRNGAIHILTDGNQIEISCFIDCSQTAAQQNSTATQPPNRQ
jgi:competence protein ComEC